ncbi:MAG: LCP family protein [Faecalibacterium sp.]
MSEQPRKINKAQADSPKKPVYATEDAPRRKRRKKKKRIPIWLPLLIVLAIVGAAGAYVYNLVNTVVEEIAPDSQASSIAEVVKTIDEYQGDVVGILVTGIDYTSSSTGSNDDLSGDGLTDMIIYVQYDVANGTMQMFQIPRNTYVGYTVTCSSTTGNTYSANNAQINSIVSSNRDDSGNGSYAALADVIADTYKLPVDYYASIDLDALTIIVDGFGGLCVYIPETIEYNGSYLEEGYRILDGDAVEFLVRNRKTYSDGDITRLNVQRYFYAALFSRVRQSTIWELAAMVPTVSNYIETDCSVTTIVSLLNSFLKVDSADIMICQAPMFYGASYVSDVHSVLVTDAEGTAELLNTYFRTYMEEYSAEDLHCAYWEYTGSSTDPNVQYMGQIDSEIVEAVEDGQDYTEEYIVRNEFNQDLVDAAAND